jgi:hypothetical protein
VTPKTCIKTTELDPKPSTEMLPKGVCPIRIDYLGLSSMCFDERYGLEVHNICNVAVRVHIDARRTVTAKESS